MKSKTVTINEKEVEIKALPFRKVLLIMKYIKTLPEKVKGSLASIELGTNKKVDDVLAIGVFADLISESGDEIIDILSVASGIPSEEIGELDIADTTKLFNALLEVNDVEEIKKEFGELGKMFNKKTK